MKKLIVGLMVVGLVGMAAGSALAGSTDSANVSLMVTPVVSIDLNVSPTYYNFGFVAVKISTCSMSALTLTNAGSVGLTVDKAVWDDAEWRIDYSSTTQDGFDLWAMTKNSQPGLATFDSEANYKFTKGTGESNFSDLFSHDTAADEDLDSEETAELWFRLDMPVFVTNTNQQTIHVRLRGFAK